MHGHIRHKSGLRQRGFGMIECALTIAVGVGIMAGGISYYETAERRQVVTDLYSSFSYIKGAVESDRAKGAKIPLGSLIASYNMVPLPGFTVKNDASILHHWSNGVQFEHHGGFVVSFVMENISAKRCRIIMSETMDQADSDGFKSIATVNGKLFTGDPASMRSDILSECAAGDIADAGWIFTPTVQDAVLRSGFLLAVSDAGGVIASNSQPPTVTSPTVTSPTTGPGGISISGSLPTYGASEGGSGPDTTPILAAASPLTGTSGGSGLSGTLPSQEGSGDIIASAASPSGSSNDVPASGQESSNTATAPSVVAEIPGSSGVLAAVSNDVTGGSAGGISPQLIPTATAGTINGHAGNADAGSSGSTPVAVVTTSQVLDAVPEICRMPSGAGDAYAYYSSGPGQGCAIIVPDIPACKISPSAGEAYAYYTTGAGRDCGAIVAPGSTDPEDQPGTTPTTPITPPISGGGSPNGNNGHGNDADGCDSSNPGKKKGCEGDTTDDDGLPGSSGAGKGNPKK